MDGECTAVVSVKDKKRRETVGGLERKIGKGEGEHASWRVRAGQVSACEARASRALEGARQAPAGPWRAGEEVEQERRAAWVSPSLSTSLDQLSLRPPARLPRLLPPLFSVFCLSPVVCRYSLSFLFLP